MLKLSFLSANNKFLLVNLSPHYERSVLFYSSEYFLMICVIWGAFRENCILLTLAITRWSLGLDGEIPLIVARVLILDVWWRSSIFPLTSFWCFIMLISCYPSIKSKVVDDIQTCHSICVYFSCIINFHNVCMSHLLFF